MGAGLLVSDYLHISIVLGSKEHKNVSIWAIFLCSFTNVCKQILVSVGKYSL